MKSAKFVEMIVITKYKWWFKPVFFVLYYLSKIGLHSVWATDKLAMHGIDWKRTTYKMNWKEYDGDRIEAGTVIKLGRDEVIQ